MIFKIAFTVLFAFAIYIFFPSIIKIYLKKRQNQVLVESGAICLTFDDGPDPRATPAIIKLLNEKQIKATFFPIGIKVEKYPYLANLISSQGHLIGEHGYSHIHAWKLNPVAYYKDLIKENTVIDNFFGKSQTRFFRPANGKVNLITLAYTLISHRQIIFWTVNSYDYKLSDTDLLVEKITAQIKKGAVILFHDGRDIGEEDPSSTVRALKALLYHKDLQGRKFATLDEVFSAH